MEGWGGRVFDFVPVTISLPIVPSCAIFMENKFLLKVNRKLFCSFLKCESSQKLNCEDAEPESLPKIHHGSNPFPGHVQGHITHFVPCLIWPLG